MTTHPISEALAAHAAGTRYNERELIEASGFLTTLLWRVQDAQAGIRAAIRGESTQALGDAAVLLAAIEPLYTQQSQPQEDTTMATPDTNPQAQDAAELLKRLKIQAETACFVEADDAAYFTASGVPSDTDITVRMLVERAVIRRAVTDLLAAGYLVAVHDGEALLDPRREVGAVMADIMSVDEESLCVYRSLPGKPFASIYLVHGNDGWDVMADYSISLEGVLSGANTLADALCDAMGH